MRLDAVSTSLSGLRIGRDGLYALIRPDLGAAVTHFESQSPSRRRVWWAFDAHQSVRPTLPLVSTGPARWAVARRSRDQVDLSCVQRDPLGVVQWIAGYLITADERGLHFALALENVSPAVLRARIGFECQLPAPIGSSLTVPPGTIGGGDDRPSGDSPFGWPRRTMLTYTGGDQLELRAQSPLARTEVRRWSDQVMLQLWAPSALAAGATLRLECRVRATLSGQPPEPAQSP